MIIEIYPEYGLDNKKLESLLTNIHSYKSLFNRIHFKEKKLEQLDIISYEILLSKDNISFYYIIPDCLKELCMNEFNIAYPKSTFNIKNQEHIPGIVGAIELELLNHSFLSLRVDKRGEFPLNEILESGKILRDDEKVLIQYILEPVAEDFTVDLEQAIDEFHQGKLRKKIRFDTKSLLRAGAKAIYYVSTEVLDIVSILLTNEEYQRDNIDEVEFNALFRKGLSENTKQKANCLLYDTSIRIVTNSPRKEMILNLFKRSFNTLKEDNKLIERQLDFDTLKQAIKKRKTIDKVSRDIYSTRELSQLLQLPTKTYQEEYKIKSIDVKEIILPSTLKKGDIRIGKVSYKGSNSIAYWNNNYNILSLPKIVVGPMGAGKTEYIKNFAIEANRKGDSVVVIDYIKNCELSYEINKHIKDAIIINISDLTDPLLLAYNEVENSNLNKLEIASHQANLLEYLIQTLNCDDTEPMSSRMKRYLYAASMISFIHSDSTINTVFEILTNYKIRSDYIKKAIDSSLYSFDSMEILDLKALDEINNKGAITGNKDTKIEGIIDRLNVLLRNIYLRRMLTGTKKINFVELFNQKKAILIRIPEAKFPNKNVKDIIVTFLLTKMWLAELLRGSISNKPGVVHIITDEIHQLNIASKFLATNIDEVRKFGCDYVFTVHYLRQFKCLLEGIKASGVNYMLLAGTEKENLKELEPELQPFKVEDGINLKPFHSLNIINNGNDRVVFTSKLPTPI